MATNENLQQINTFTGGMNTDVSDSMLQNSLYREARNLRIVTNTDSNTGELRLIEGGTLLYDGENYKVLAITSCRDLGIVITRGEEQSSAWYVYKFHDGDISLEPVLMCRESIPDEISVETVYESEDNIKLYIADGIHPILVINCANEYEEFDDVSKFTNLSNVTLTPIANIIKTTGTLKPAMVQYSYLYYTKYGTSTLISPLSSLYPVDTLTSNVLSGLEYDTLSTTGYLLTIPVVEDFDSLIVYRITYLQSGLLPTIEIIYNGFVNDIKETITVDNTEYMRIQVADISYSNILSSITVELYTSFGGILLKPKVIKSMDNLLFAANCSEISVSEEEYARFQDWDASTDVNPNLDLANDYLLSAWTIYYDDSDKYLWLEDPSQTACGVFGQNCALWLTTRGKRLDSIDRNRKGQALETLDQDGFKTLRSNEVYRYGIVLYHSDGSTHPVKWIGDIRIPDTNSGFYYDGTRPRYIVESNIELSVITRYDLFAKLPVVNVSVRNLPLGCIGYEIVRCKRTLEDSSTISQGVIAACAKPLHEENSNLLFPTGYAVLNKIEFDGSKSSVDVALNVGTDKTSMQIYSETTIDDYLIFYSPEVVYLPSYIQNALNTYKQNIKLHLDQLALVSETYVNTVESIVQAQVFQVSTYPGTSVPLSTVNQLAHTANLDYKDPHSLSMSIYRISAEAVSPLFYALADPRAANLTLYNRRNALHQRFDDPFTWYKTELGAASDPVATDDRYLIINNEPVYVREVKGSIDVSTVHSIADLRWMDDSSKNGTADITGNRKLSVYSRLYDLRSISNTYSRDVDITDFVIPPVANYNEFSDASGNLIFKDAVTAINNKSYNGWVAHMLYGYMDSGVHTGSDKYDESTYQWSYNITPESEISSQLSNNLLDGRYATRTALQDKYRYAFAPIGPGGKCLVLSGRFLDNEYIKYSHYRAVAGEGHPTLSSNLTTFLCNICRKGVLPYGGTSEFAKQKSVYFSTGYYKAIDDVSQTDNGKIPYNLPALNDPVTTQLIKDGDCFINCFEFFTLHQSASATLKNHVNASIIYSVPVETDIDLLHTHGASYSRSQILDSGNQYHSLLQEEPASFLSYYNLTKPLHQYNTAYSTLATVKSYIALNNNIDTESNRHHDNRIYYSNAKQSNESIDNWTLFLPANFLDVDILYGAVTHLDTFNGNLFFWQEDAFGLLPVHERVLMQDDNNLTLMLGVGGVLERYDYLSTLKGMKDGQFASTKSQAGLYWWDEERNELQVYRIGSAPTALSKEKGILNYLNEAKANSRIDSKPALTFDPKYDEVLACVTKNNNTNDAEQETIVFNEQINAYSSLYDLGFVGGITINGNTYLATNEDRLAWAIAKWNTPTSGSSKYPKEGDIYDLMPSIKYVVNKQPMYVKTYDNQVFAGKFYGGSDTVDNYNSLPYYVPGEHNNSPLSVLQFDYYTPLKQHGSTTGDKLTNREYDFRLAIPRCDFSGNVPEYLQRGNRLRGKTMQCRLSSSSNSLDFSLQHIITKFRISWS